LLSNNINYNTSKHHLIYFRKSVKERERGKVLKLIIILKIGLAVFMRLMHKMKEEIPRFELEIIEDSDHWIIFEHPEEFGKLLLLKES
jgi:hypothetical protein